MEKFNAYDCGRYIRAHQNPLILAGDGCDHIKLDHKMLADYAADFAVKLDCQVAATGNTINGMKKYQGIKIRKAWLVELMTSLKGEWADPILPKRPDLLIFIGYRPEMIDGIIAGLERIGTVHLGPGKSVAAEYSMEAVTFSEWKINLDALIGSIE